MRETLWRWLGARHGALLILLAALLVRVALAAVLPQEIVWYDGERYYAVAQSLLDGNGFGDLYMNRLSIPTLPLLIAGLEAIVGRGNFLALRVGMAVIGALGCLVGYLLAARWFDRRTALLAGLGLAFYPLLAYTSALFEYPQTLFVLLMAAFFVLFHHFQQSGSLGALLGSAACLAIATLTVPTLLLYLPFFLLCILLAGHRRAVLKAAMASLVVALVVGSWTYRNYQAYGVPILINAAGGLNLWIANNETYYAHGKEGVIPPCGPGYEDETYCRQSLAINARQEQENLPMVERILQHEALAKANAMEFILESPARFIGLSLRRFYVFWSPGTGATSSGEGMGGALREWIAALTYLPVLALGAVGIYLTRARWRLFLPFYLYVLTLAGAHSIFLPTARYRLPVDFILILFAAFAVTAWLQRRRPAP